MPAQLKYLSTTFDIIFLTFILLVADGVQSPLTVGYFLLIAVSALRFNVRLVRLSTLGCMAGYLFLLGYARWGSLARPPHYYILIFLLALGMTGVVLGQLVRRVRSMAEEILGRSEAVSEATK